MKTHKMTVAVLTLLMSIGITACGDKDDKGKTRIRRGANRTTPFNGGNTGPSGTTPPGPNQQGSLAADWPGQFQSADQIAVDDFIAASSNPLQTIGFLVTNQPPIRLRGQVTTNQGNFNGANNASVTGGQIELLVIDDVAMDNGGYYLVIPLGNATGTVNGNSVNITVSDVYGQVSLSGNVSSNGNFDGQATFQNSQHHDDAYQCEIGNSPCSGTLGRFTIPICSLLRCQ